ncbi:hypothetical protein [Persicirhabdus sediminis]|uniref:Uncharacterized protein n=1 Tax=Persicirhabdus sediminis TaxID=454144 RepID=A0A8J7SKC4_9BACT|nr:hypothetical protein [Persicirhabdus sediminis]MBK1790690.1 hypothetical protein [Persicirhabdus sediminis]
MKTLIQAILATLIMLSPCYAFVVPLKFAEKCERSDAIIRGVVLDIITVAGEVEDSSGGKESILEGAWTGPHSIAVIRVVSVIKDDENQVDSVIFVPCGYSYDESPCELTKSKDYILFLDSMSRNYFHPLGPFCMHRVKNELVGMSGFDWDGDFDSSNENRETVPLEEFVKRIKDDAARAKNDD